jgi:CSLREA domain-containing protein
MTSRLSFATDFSVNSTADRVDLVPGDGTCETSISAECTLRAAIQETNALPGADTINLPPGVYLLSLAGRREDVAASGDLDMSDALTVTGAGSERTIVDANTVDRVFDIRPGATVVISGVTARGGDLAATGVFGDHGGGIHNEGVLALEDVVVAENNAGEFGIGGGIFNRGALVAQNVDVIFNSAEETGGIASMRRYGEDSASITLSDVVIADNSSLLGVAGMVTGLGASLPGEPRDSAVLTNVTISGNVSGLCSACAGGFSNLDDATLTHVTIAHNQGHGIFGLIGPFTPVTSLENTIVANNGSDCGTGVVSLGHNLDSDGTCNLIATGDLPGTNPRLGMLQDNGGSTLTHALLAGSPAIDAASLDCPPPAVDQRGQSRLVDGNGDEVIRCDMGAFEFVPTRPRILAEKAWTAGNGHVYVVVELQGRPWEDARTDVATWLPGFHLATVSSEEEQNFLDQELLDPDLTSQFWLGGHQVAPQPETDPTAGWRWVTGEPWLYTHWGPSEPNDAGGMENHLTTSLYYGWNDEGTAISSVGGYIAESGDRVALLSPLRSSSIDGHLEVAASLRLGDENRLSIFDVVTGQVIGHHKVPDPARSVESLVTIDDVTGGGMPDIAVLGASLKPTDSRMFVRACEDGAFVRNQPFFTGDWVTLDAVSMPDLGGGVHDDLAVLGANRLTGEIAVQIRDSVTGAFVRNVFYLAAPMQPRQLVVVEGFDPNPGPELGVLMTEEGGRHILMIKDAGTGAFAGNLFFLNANWEAVQALVLPDFNGNSAAEIGLLARHRTSGMLVVMIKDAASNAFLKNIFPFGSGWRPVRVAALPDENNNQAVELATLGVNGLTGKPIIQVRDALTGQFLRNLRLLGTSWEVRDMVALEDIGGGVSGLSIFAERKIDGVPVVQTIDSASGSRLSNVFLH